MMDTKELLTRLTKRRVNKVIGIYLLFQDDEIVYIGQSKNVGHRVYTHLAKGKKRFNHCAVYDCSHLPQSEINCLEAKFIIDLVPKYNATVPENSKFKSLEQLKVILRERGIYLSNGWKLKKWIKEKGITQLGMGYYKMSDFEGLK
jgi:excinuclease UvrABC nuclease subunit